MLAAVAPVTSAVKAGPAEHVTALTDASDVEEAEQKARFWPTNGAAEFADVASPVAMSDVVVLFAATIEVEPPAEVTAPMTSPATPSPVEELAAWRDVMRLLPSWRLTAAASEMSEAVMTGPAVHVAAL